MPPLRGKRQTHASPKRQSKIQRELISKGLPIEFAGRNVDQWKLGGLKKLISISTRMSAPKVSRNKHSASLCITLLKIKRETLTAEEEAMISAVISKNSPKTVEAAQYHIRMTTGDGDKSRVTCDICTMSKSIADFPKPSDTSSAHSHWEFLTCLDCLKSYITAKSWVSKTLTTITCPEDKCTAHLETVLMQHGDAEILEQDCRYVVAQAVRSLAGYIECSNQFCLEAEIISPNSSPGATYQCAICQMHTCITCGTLAHPRDISCPQNLINLKELNNKKIREKINAHHAAPRMHANSAWETVAVADVESCPNPDIFCAVPLSWQKGCPNIRCLVCNIKFCWCCRMPILKGGFCDHILGKKCGERLGRHVERVRLKYGVHNGSSDGDLGGGSGGGGSEQNRTNDSDSLEKKMSAKDKYLLEMGRRMDQEARKGGRCD